MVKIKLSRGTWEYDPNYALGQAGGFGAVFLGRGDGYKEVAIKRLHPDKSSKAHREIDISDYLLGQELDHVISVLDAGKDSVSNGTYIVMVRAEKSLQQELDNIGLFTFDEAAGILYEIGLGLMEVQGIVHRDLKPANVLYHDGKWKISDFGISRFVEASTTSRTLADYLSAQYAAPEQWMSERVTSATDVYALGCIGYALLTGMPPFSGSSREDYRIQHLESAPPDISDVPQRLRMLLLMMLQKTPQMRPATSRVVRLLAEMSSVKPINVPQGFRALEQAGNAIAEETLLREAAEAEYVRDMRQREAIAQNAARKLQVLLREFFERVQRSAPMAELDHSDRSLLFQFRLGSATIKVSPLGIPEGSFKQSGWDVISGYTIELIQSAPKKYVWSANFWYTNLGKPEYRWWEVLYMYHPFVKADRQYEPFALRSASEADKAASLVEHNYQFAAEPRPIDDEDSEDFFDRWAQLFADAAQGKLTRPGRLPLD